MIRNSDQNRVQMGLTSVTSDKFAPYDTNLLFPPSRNLTCVRLQETIDYIHAHLDRDLSLVKLSHLVTKATRLQNRA